MLTGALGAAEPETTTDAPSKYYELFKKVTIIC
jgi:hypothetical protein